jgi:membrane-associated phospholipid phosphatase
VRRALVHLAAVLALGSPSVRSAAAVGDVDLAARPEADRPRLEVRQRTAAAIGGTVLVLWAAAAVESSADTVTRCRWCDPPGVDRWGRRELRWRDADGANDAADVLLLAVPLASAAAVGWLAARNGSRREAVEDVLLVAASVALTDPLTRGVQHGAGRLRPEAWAEGRTPGDRDLRSFFSGHTSRVFAAAAAATRIAHVRGRGGWGWIAAAGLTLATATGWLRVAGDQHWVTDVLAGAALGTSVGWAVPTTVLRPLRRGTSVAVLPEPGGLAIVF